MIYLVRHAETENNTKTATGLVNPLDEEPLNKRGEEQTLRLADYFNDKKIGFVYSSEAVRASKTAEPIAKKQGLKVIKSPLLNERNWGELGKLSWPELTSTLDRLSIDERYRFVPPQGESWLQLEKRVLKFIRSLTTQERTDIVVVTHNGCIRALLPALTQENRGVSLKINPPNGAIVPVEILSDGTYKVGELIVVS